MSRRQSTFRERDVRAAMRAVEKAGKEVQAVEIERDGTIRILTRQEAREGRDGKGWEDV